MKHSAQDLLKEPPLTGLKTLVVDDSAACRMMEAAMCRRLGAEADVAETAIKAQALTASEKYDLVILDIGLADADGRVLCSTIREQGASQDAAILCVSGLGGDDRRETALRAGADGFAEKPFDSVQGFAMAACAALDSRGVAPTGPYPEAAEPEEPISASIAAHALTDLKRARKRLFDSMAAGDVCGVRRTAHFLSGVAGVLNDRALGEASQRVQGATGETAGLRAIETMLTRVADATERLRSPAT